jgi:hypothetical protein
MSASSRAKIRSKARRHRARHGGLDQSALGLLEGAYRRAALRTVSICADRVIPGAEGIVPVA